MVSLDHSGVKKQPYQFLRNKIFLIEREVFYGEEEVGFCEDGGVKSACDGDG